MSEDRGWAVHECSACKGFHVTICGEMVIGGDFRTREEADEAARRLNAGEDTNEVLGWISPSTPVDREDTT